MQRPHLTADDDVIAGGVDREGADAAAGQQLLDERLLGQVVDAHMVLGGHKEEGLSRVERHSHHAAPVLSEGVLRCLLGQLVHQHCL